MLTLIPDVSCETAVVECLMDLFKRPIDPISTWRALSCTLACPVSIGAGDGGRTKLWDEE